MSIIEEFPHSLDDELLGILFLMVESYLPLKNLLSPVFVRREEVLRFSPQRQRTHEPFVIIVKLYSVRNLCFFSFLPQRHLFSLMSLSTSLTVATLRTSVLDLYKALQVTLVIPHGREFRATFLGIDSIDDLVRFSNNTYGLT